MADARRESGEAGRPDDGLDACLRAAFTPPPAPGPAPATEERLGPYRLVREIGRGGQAVVHLAEDTRLRRRVAVKALTCARGISEEACARFEREARIASKLQHPGICGLLDFGLHEEVPYLVMPYVEGESLAARLGAARDGGGVPLRLRPEDPPSLPALLAFFEKAALAVHAAHEAGVVHRDLKPGNLMVTPQGEPVVLDFGVAREEAGPGPALTLAGEVFGTPAYMSPEQLRPGAHPPDRRTDVWSLGVALHECLTLRRPFDAVSRAALHREILTRDPPDPRSFNPSLPRDLGVVLARALEKEPGKRYGTARELAEELRRVREGRPVVARRAGPLARLTRWARRERAMAATLLAVLVGLGASLASSLAFLAQTRAAIVRVRDARASAGEETRLANAAAEKAGQALSEYERLADIRRLQDLLREQRHDLWPALPDKVPGMDAWLARARALAGRLPEHQAALRGLRARAAAYTAEERARDRAAHETGGLAVLRDRIRGVEAALGHMGPPESLPPEDAQVWERLAAELSDLQRRLGLAEAEMPRRTWTFPDMRDRWRHDLETVFLGDLEAFVTGEPRKETIRSVEERRALAAAVGRRTIEEEGEAWALAAAAVAGDPRYGGLALAPQLGLVPLGPDPDSGLQEFCHVQTGERPERDPETGRLRFTERSGLVLVLLPGGAFLMGAQAGEPGSPNHDPLADRSEGPVHRVALSPFLLSKHEMTQGQWRRATGGNPSHLAAGYRLRTGGTMTLLHPVEQVTFGEAAEVLRRLGLVLPTEAQWEYACRAGTSTPWWSGAAKETLRGAANLADRSAAREGARWAVFQDWPELDDGWPVHAPADRFRPNAFGLLALTGNVAEWCADPEGTYREPVRAGDGLRLAVGEGRIARGGSFKSSPVEARSAARFAHKPDFKDVFLGLRPARRLEE